jgi:hypothetical protein
MTVTQGVGSPQRPFVMVLCQSYQPNITASMSHLVNDLGVQAVLGALAPPDLITAFGLTETATLNYTPVFFVNPFEADNALLNTNGAATGIYSGLLWHMLGPYTDLTPAYAAVVNLVAASVRQTLGVDASTPLNVAIVDVGTEVDFSADLRGILPSAISVNNGVTLNDPSNTSYFLQTSTESSALHPSPTVDSALTELETFQPDIVISLGTDEFLSGIVPKLEQNLTSKPFYVLSPPQGFSTVLTQADGAYFTQNRMPFAYTRMVGVNYATYPNRTLYNTYISTLQATFPSVPDLAHRENFYDATYFLMYSLAYASQTTTSFTADDIGTGMRNLVSTSPTAFQATVGSGSGNMQVQVLSALMQGPVALTGTMGPPDFDVDAGARNSEGNGWCVQNNGTVDFDVLVYEPPTDGGLGTLTVQDGGVCGTGL